MGRWVQTDFPSNASPPGPLALSGGKVAMKRTDMAQSPRENDF